MAKKLQPEKLLNKLKSLKTQEERDTFARKVFENATPEQRESVAKFAKYFLYVAAIMTGRNDLLENIPGLPEVPEKAKRVPEFIELLKQQDDLMNLSLSDFVKSERFRELAVSFFTQEPEPAPKKEKPTQTLPEVINYGFMNDLATWEMKRKDGTLDLDGQMSLWWEVLKKKGNEVIPVYVSLSYAGEDVKTSKRLSIFDMEVINAISTIFFYWRQKEPILPLRVTPSHVWRIMNGKQLYDNKAKPNKKQQDRICKSIDKLRFTKITIDLLKELKAFGYVSDDDRLSETGMSDYGINARKITEKTLNGSESTIYIIQYEPLLFSYNRLCGHVLVVPLELLDTSSNTRDTENTLEFKSYLLLRIKGIISGAFNNNEILIDTIYKETGVKPPAERLDRNNFSSDASYSSKVRIEAKKDRDKMIGILTAWKDKDFMDGNMTDYKLVKKKGSIVGFEIFYERKKSSKINDKTQ